MASLDDPYADATLIDIEDGFVKLRERLATNIEALRQLLGDTEGMTIHQSFSVKPLTLPLEFKTPYFGFEASRVVKYFDRLVLFALATKQTGDILQSDWNRLVNKTGTNIRHVFFMAAQYRVTGVTRDDFAANNAKARAAIEKYGELPQDILEGRKRARHAPKIRKVG
jgi:integrating conjugative element protein (TIGR03761 family)